MGFLITLIIWIVVFGVVAYGAWWVCVHFSMPQPVMWIVGAILLIVLLLWIANQAGISGASLPPLRR